MCVPGSLTAIAAAADSSKQAVSNWRSGKKKPGVGARAKLQTAYGIPVTAWEQRPVGRASTVPPAARYESAPPPDADAGELANPTTMQSVEELLRVIRADRRRADIIGPERMKLADSEARLLALKHRLEREAELLEDRIVKQHPMWTRILTAIGDTLVGWPEAARAVAAKLREL